MPPKCLPLELVYEIVPFIPAENAISNALSSCRLLHKLLLPRVIKWQERMSNERAFNEFKQSIERELNEFKQLMLQRFDELQRRFDEQKPKFERVFKSVQNQQECTRKGLWRQIVKKACYCHPPPPTDCLPPELLYDVVPFVPAESATPNALLSYSLLLHLLLPRVIKWKERKDEGTSPRSQSSLDLASHMEAASQAIQLLQSKLEQGTSGAAVQPRSVPSAAGGSYVRKMVKAFDNGRCSNADARKHYGDKDKQPDIWLDPTHHSIIVYWKAVERAATYRVYKVVDRRLVLVREVAHMGDGVVHDCNCGGLKASMSHTFTVIAFGPNGEMLKRFDNVTGRYFPELG